MTIEQISSLIASQRNFFAQGTTRNIGFRKQQLRAFKKGLQKWEKALTDALWQDLHKSYEEAYLTEVALVYAEIDDALKNLNKWARSQQKWPSMSVAPGRCYVVREPLGTALIISPWNYPIQLLLSPLVGAIAAGCTALLKPSPYVPTVSETLQKMIEETFPPEYIALVQGGREVNAMLLAQRYDLVFFTGSPALAKVVAAAQAPYLTPLVLELGGKSPCIVDEKANVELAARRIVWGKSLNSGQTCIAPDYLFLHESIKERFIEAFKRALNELYPEGTQNSPYYVHLVQDRAFARIESYLQDGQVVAGGRRDAQTRWFEPTLLDQVSPEAPVMQEEIFGPIFPILSFKDREEVLAFVNAREKPLAFYYFGKESDGWEMIRRTSSGGACINDVILHIANSRMPFGGVGNSGMGNYHSERSFLAFSHERAVLSSPTWLDLPFRYMPYKLFQLIKKML